MSSEQLSFHIQLICNELGSQQNIVSIYQRLSVSGIKHVIGNGVSNFNILNLLKGLAWEQRPIRKRAIQILRCRKKSPPSRSHIRSQGGSFFYRCLWLCAGINCSMLVDPLYAYCEEIDWIISLKMLRSVYSQFFEVAVESRSPDTQISFGGWFVAAVPSNNPKGRVPPACPWVNETKFEYWFWFYCHGLAREYLQS